MMAETIDPPRMQLLDWRRIDKGALLGKASVQLPNGLQLAEIGIFATERGRWAQLPSEMMRDAAGMALTDDRGKPRYRSLAKWKSRELQDRFSHSLIALIEAEHGPLDGGAAG